MQARRASGQAVEQAKQALGVRRVAGDAGAAGGKLRVLAPALKLIALVDQRDVGGGLCIEPRLAHGERDHHRAEAPGGKA